MRQNLALVSAFAPAIALTCCLKVDSFLMLAPVDNPIWFGFQQFEATYPLDALFGYFFIQAIRNLLVF